MASTIIIKNGTGSATPSSLQQGELALNVNSGKLFYGTSGSSNSVSSSFTFDDLTVTNLTTTNITSSIITASIIETSGSNIFGDASTDTHLFRGDITASGNISASGTIVGSNLSGTNTGDQDLSAYALTASISGAFATDSASFSTRVTANDAKLTANTSNVTTAGALMDSELTEIATVKALTAANISGSFTAASASFSTRVTANDAKVSYTDAAVTSVINTAGVLSSSAQIASDISGSFTAASASFSTRVTANDAKVTANTANVQSALNNQSLDIGSGTLTANTIDVDTDIDITTNNEFLRGKLTGGVLRNVIGIDDSDNVTVGNSTADSIKLIGDVSGSGTVQLKPRLELPKTSNTDADYYGTVVYFGSNTSGMTAGTIVYYRSTGAWNNAQANSTTTSLGLLGVALGSAASDGVLIQGTVTLNHDPGAIGDTLYLSDTNAGRATSTVPSSTNDVVRVIGYCLDASNGQIYFNPSSDHIVHA